MADCTSARLHEAAVRLAARIGVVAKNKNGRKAYDADLIMNPSPSILDHDTIPAIFTVTLLKVVLQDVPSIGFP
jgi:hypothetical protein